MKQIPFVLLVLTLFAAACAPAAAPRGNDQSVVSPNDAPLTGSPTMNKPASTQYPIITPLPQKTDNTIPRRGDQSLGGVYLNSVDLLVMESFPLQFSLEVTGNLPTPCHQLTYAVNPPDAENKIVVELGALQTGSAVCIQVLQPFSAVIPLGSFPTGHYTVWIGGKQAAEFDA